MRLSQVMPALPPIGARRNTACSPATLQLTLPLQVLLTLNVNLSFSPVPNIQQDSQVVVAKAWQ